MTDKERLDWLEEKMNESGYAVQIQRGVTPPSERVVLTTGVGSGPWMRTHSGFNVRTVIDKAIDEEMRYEID